MASACLCGMVHLQKDIDSLPIPDRDLVAAEIRRIAHDHVEAASIRGEHLGPGDLGVEEPTLDGQSDSTVVTMSCGRAWGLVVRVANHSCVGAGAAPGTSGQKNAAVQVSARATRCRYSSRRCTPSNSAARIVTSATESSAPAPMLTEDLDQVRRAGRPALGPAAAGRIVEPFRFSAVGLLGHRPCHRPAPALKAASGMESVHESYSQSRSSRRSDGELL